MRILGIDPGLERVGFGVIQPDSQKRYHAEDWGVIQTSKNDSEASRLSAISKSLDTLIHDVKPDIAAIERLFFFRNAKTLVPVCQARGVILMALYHRGLTYSEYTPMQIKQCVSGYGKSSKKEIQVMVQQILQMSELPRPDDAADALAIALTCAFERGSVGVLSSV